MRRTIMTLGLLLPIAACGGGDDSWYSGSGGRQQSGATTAPTVPPQAGQSGQSSQQARRNIGEQPGGQQALSGTTGMSGASGMTGAGAMQLSAAEQGFIIEAAQHGMAEVELGRLAEQRGSSAQVRDFGRMMVQQHTQANQELMGIAQRMGITPPTSLSPAAQAVQMRLQAAQGQDFDRQYLEHQAADHLTQRSMFQFAANNARTPELRGFAQRTLPVVERHIDQLRTIAPTATRTGS